MAIAWVQSTNIIPSSGGNCVKAFTSNVTGGNCIVVAGQWGTGTAGASGNVTDNKSNSYTLVQQVNDSANSASVGLWVALNVASGATTVTFTNSSTFTAMVINEYSGIATSSATDGSTGQTSTGGSTSANAFTSGNFTTTVNGDLIVATVMDITNGSATWTAGTNFTIHSGQASTPTNQMDAACEDRVQATASASTAGTFTGSNTDQGIVVVIALKAASGTPTVDMWHPRIETRFPQKWEMIDY